MGDDYWLVAPAFYSGVPFQELTADEKAAYERIVNKEARRG